MKKTARAFALVLLASLGLASLGTGCGSSASSLCNDACNCVKCSDADLKNCVDQANAAEQQANDKGCGSQFSDLVACGHDNLSCVNPGAISKACSGESTVLAKCIAGGK